jgi:hypothetical protein
MPRLGRYCRSPGYIGRPKSKESYGWESSRRSGRRVVRVSGIFCSPKRARHPRKRGGYETELDVVAFNPGNKSVVHVEASLDCHCWTTRESRFEKKFSAGRKAIPSLFKGFSTISQIDQIALLVYAPKDCERQLGGGRVMHVSSLISEILQKLSSKRLSREAVPEQFPLIRTLQYVCENRRLE